MDEQRAAAAHRLRVLDAIVRVLDERDRFMALVAESDSASEARRRLIDEWGLDESQATAALDLQVRRFGIEERRRIRDERAEIARQLAY